MLKDSLLLNYCSLAGSKCSRCEVDIKSTIERGLRLDYCVTFAFMINRLVFLTRLLQLSNSIMMASKEIMNSL